MTPVEVLRAARAKIAPGAWCQNAFALDANGADTDDPLEPDATAWCALGALHCAENADSAGDLIALPYLERAVPAPFDVTDDPVAYFNDDCGTYLDDVLALFDRAIAAAEKEEVR